MEHLTKYIKLSHSPYLVLGALLPTLSHYAQFLLLYAPLLFLAASTQTQELENALSPRLIS